MRNFIRKYKSGIFVVALLPLAIVFTTSPYNLILLGIQATAFIIMLFAWDIL